MFSLHERLLRIGYFFTFYDCIFFILIQKIHTLDTKNNQLFFLFDFFYLSGHRVDTDFLVITNNKSSRHSTKII